MIQIHQLFILIIFALSSLAVKSHAAAELPKTCVVSLFGDDKLDRMIHQDAIQLLRSMGYEDPESRFVYFTEASAIRHCLQGSYEDMVLLMHSVPINKEYSALTYRYIDSKGRIVGQYLPQELFKNISVGPNLRQITLVSCNTEKVINNYSAIIELARQNNVYIKLQLSDVISEATGTQLRTYSLAAANIAESAQDIHAENIYCTLRTNLVVLLEHGKTSCLRNHFRVRFTAPLAAGLKTSTRWLKLSIDKESQDDENFAFFNLEIGFMRGLNFEVSDQPLAINKETYGGSFSLFNHISIFRVGERKYGYSSND